MGKKEKGKETGAPAGTPGKKGRQAAGPEREGFPKWLPPVLYGAVTLLLFRRFVFSGEMLLGQDTLSLGLVARDFFAQALKSGVFPLWNPVILGGTPFLDSLAGGDSLYPTSILLVLMEPFRALGWKLVLHVFGAGLFAYGWIRALGRSREAALLSGLAYLLAPFMVTLVYPGHDGKLFVTALTPLLFWAVERALVAGRLRAFGGMALVIGLVILTTHFQQAYFLFGAVGVYALVRVALLWRAGLSPRLSAARFATFLAFSFLGAGIAGIQLLPAVSYVTEHSRRTATTTQATEEGSVAYSSSWSLHPEEVASLIVPEFAGNSAGGAEWATGTYWGRNVFKLNHEYAGLVVLLLAVLSFFGAAGRGIRLTFAGVGGVALLFALGAHTPVWRVFYELLPGISLFRAPSISAFLFGFAAVTLMAYGVDRVLGLGEPGTPSPRSEGEKKSKTPIMRQDRGMVWFLAGSSVFFLFGAAMASSGVLTSIWTSSFYADITPAKTQALARAQEFIGQGFFLATVLSALTLLLVLGALKRKITPLLWVLGVGVLVTVDLGRVDHAFIQTLAYQDWERLDPNIQFLREQKETQEPFRVLAMGGNNDGQDVKPGLYGLDLAAGHHPNDLARYRELIGMVGSGIPSNFFDPETGGLQLPLLSTLNVRYVIWPVHRYGGLPQGEVVMATTLGNNQVYEAVYEIPTLPRARLVQRAVVLSDSEVVPYIISDQYRPLEEVVLTEEPSIPLSGGIGTGEVRWLEKGLNRLRLEVESDAPALLLLAENWYPAWKAEVGGEEVPVLRANHSLRAVP
ncbi:MAG: hypothetical protein KJN92_10800, partial [Gemmatimonadetes bacterium]|nr:hypothetical protein [Gemmatimonadota bacterium]